MQEPSCPVCRGPVEHWEDVMDGWCLRESYFRCLGGCYTYEYAYGHTDIAVGDQHFHRWHEDDPGDFQDLVDKALGEARARLLIGSLQL